MANLLFCDCQQLCNNLPPSWLIILYSCLKKQTCNLINISNWSELLSSTILKYWLNLYHICKEYSETFCLNLLILWTLMLINKFTMYHYAELWMVYLLITWYYDNKSILVKFLWYWNYKENWIAVIELHKVGMVPNTICKTLYVHARSLTY